MPFEDEMPEVPQSTDAAAVIDDQIDASAFAGVGFLGDTMPAGTFHFRLDSFTEVKYDDGPSFNLQWRCQEEPHTGRVLFDSINWVEQADIVAANDPSNPRVNEARGILNKRLVRANSLMKEAGFKPSGKFGFKDFLNTHPEVKIIVTIVDKKEMIKDANGAVLDAKGQKQFRSTGEPKNKAVKYVSLARPS